MDNDEDIQLHALETIERNLSGDTASAAQDEQRAFDGFGVYSPSGFAVYSASGFAVYSASGFAVYSASGFMVY